MKYSVFVVLFLTYTACNKLNSQIPNASFELWESIDIENYNKPLHWETNQDSNHIRFMRSEDSVEGDYSLKIIDSSQTAWTDCNNRARSGVKLPTPIGNNKALSFYVKSVLDSFNQSGYVFLWIQVYTFASGDYIERLDWMNYDVITKYTQQKIPILNPDIDSLDIWIIGGAANGATDGCHDRNTTWIDALKIDTLLSTSIMNVNPDLNVSVYPNPSKGIINLKCDLNHYQNYELVNSLGQIIEKGPLHKPQIQTNYKGVCFLRLLNNSEQIETYTSKVVLVD